MTSKIVMTINQWKQQEKPLPVTAKKIRAPGERLVGQSPILPLPEESRKRHDVGAAFGQKLQCLRMRNAEAGKERALKCQADGGAHQQSNAQDD